MNYYNNTLKQDYLKMKKNAIENLSFTHKFYKTNFDLINKNDNIITECECVINKLRIKEKLPPLLVGECNLSIWNLKLGFLLNADIPSLIHKFRLQDSYLELYNVIQDKKHNINGYNKIIIIHNVIIKKEYRKHDVLNELIESIYRDYNDEKIAIIMYVKPIQFNKHDFELFSQIKNFITYENHLEISGKEFYSLDELEKITDVENSELKLFQRAHDCGFDRIEDSNLFILSEDFILNRLIMKIDK